MRCAALLTAFCPALLLSIGLLAQTADEWPTAEVSVCSAPRLTGQARGLCVAYCEGADCDSATPHAAAEACAALSDHFTTAAGEPPLCEPWDCESCLASQAPGVDCDLRDDFLDNGSCDLPETCEIARPEEYLNQFGTDPTFLDALERAASLGADIDFTLTAQCALDDLSVTPVAYVAQLIRPNDGPLIIVSSSDLPPSLTTILIDPQGDSVNLILAGLTMSFDFALE